ncbi:phage major capsid protein, HK97 family [Atlantibacter hermannii]|nr:phage major capsid protein, HK97 family [Atlantibacter hermannii]
MTKRQKRQTEEEIEKLEEAEEEIEEVEEEVGAEIEEEEREDEVDEQVAEAVDIAAVAEAVMEIIEEREKRSNKKNKVRNVMTVKKDTIQTLESRFDLGEAIRCQLENKPMSGANKEFMQEQERKFGAARHAGGMHIPVSALAAGKRAAPSYSQASGTLNKVQQDVLKLDSFVDLLMPESLLGKLGVQTLTGQTERSILIPKQTATAVDSFGWVKEGADVPGGKGSYDNVPLSPKTFGGETVLTRRALTTTPGIQARVASDIVRNSALKLEKDMFGSSATDGPQSLLEQIPALRFGAAEWDYKNFLRILAEMTDKGVREEMIQFAMKGATKAELKGILKDANSLGLYLVGDDDKLVGRDIHSSGIFGGAEMLMGDFSAITIAEWSGLELVVDPWSYAKSGDIALRVFCDMDWAFTGQEGSLIHLKKGTVTK